MVFEMISEKVKKGIYHKRRKEEEQNLLFRIWYRCMVVNKKLSGRYDTKIFLFDTIFDECFSFDVEEPATGNLNKRT